MGDRVIEKLLKTFKNYYLIRNVGLERICIIDIKIIISSIWYDKAHRCFLHICSILILVLSLYLLLFDSTVEKLVLRRTTHLYNLL